MTSKGPAAVPAPLRFRYSKVVGNCLRFVIVDRLADGGLEFWSQEPGDVRWFSFEPSVLEREAVVASWRASDRAGGWPLLIP